MESKYHPNWQNNRIKFILNNYGTDFFKDKRILELGPFNGYIGNFFKNIGADVTMLEGRQANIDNILKSYPDSNVMLHDIDNPEWTFGKFDIILNFGVFYHLEKFHEKHLVNCINNCDLMFFESVIFDSDDDILFFQNEQGEDQSLSGASGTPSTKYIENIFLKHHVNFKKITNGELNGDGHQYDWIDTNSQKYCAILRRFWIVQM